MIVSSFLYETLNNLLYLSTGELRADPDNKISSLFYLAYLFFWVVLLNPTKKVGGRQVNFTKTFENKEFKRKLTNYF